VTRYRNIAFLAVVGVFAASLAVSAMLSLSRGEDGRKIFYFPDSDGRVHAETRLLFSGGGDGISPERYVSDLLLGPENPRFRSLFNPRTRVVSCFAGDGTLYVDLSAHALYPDGTTCSIREGAELLAGNVARNFRQISRVSLFIDGKKAFRDAPEE
jgi:hypothetical protein